MQPTPSEHSPSTATENNALAQSNSSHQYGHVADQSATPPLSGDESGGVSIPLDEDSYEQSSIAGSPSHLSSLGGLSPPHTPVPTARNRVSEYESASTAATRSRLEGPVFQVIQTPRQPGDKRSPIADLPNGERACF